MKPEDKESVLEEVISRVLAQKVQDSYEGKNSLEVVINDTIYHERKRLEQEKSKKKRKKGQEYWKSINKRLVVASEEEQKRILKEITENFSREIIGNFNPRVYGLVTGVIPNALAMFLSIISPGILISHFPKLASLPSKVFVRGEVALIQELQKKGTVILVPTHSSNMDSIVVGWALHSIGLPPFTYGAGINLFTNRLISYFMNNLGAYKVDRKKTASLYKEVLKEYATITLEYGYHNLFFPGGTRSRSGSVEEYLKLGLLGTSVRAYTNNLINKKEKNNIFVVPCTISYNLVLEAENLIDDFLKETGKSRYIIEDDEFSQPSRLMSYFKSILALDSKIYVNLCPPMDLFGNRVDVEGNSFDQRGRQVDISRYVIKDGKLNHDRQRDAQYIKELGEKIKVSYKKYNIAMCTNLVAFTLFNTMKKNNPEMDLYRLLRTGGKEENFPLRNFLESLDRVVQRVKDMESKGELRLDETLHKMNAEEILERALLFFWIYHTKQALFRRGERIYPEDNNLIFYYHNRLVGYGLEEYV